MLIFSMANILRPEVLEALGMVLLPVVIGVLAKIVSLSRKYKGGVLNELNIGVDLMVTALVVILTRSADRSIALNGLTILSLVAILFGNSVIIRFWGWRNKNDLHRIWGVTFPGLIGLAVLCYVFENYY